MAGTPWTHPLPPDLKLNSKYVGKGGHRFLLTPNTCCQRSRWSTQCLQLTRNHPTTAGLLRGEQLGTTRAAPNPPWGRPATKGPFSPTASTEV